MASDGKQIVLNVMWVIIIGLIETGFTGDGIFCGRVVAFKVEGNIFFVIFYFCACHAVKEFEDYGEDKSPERGGKCTVEISCNISGIRYQAEK